MAQDNTTTVSGTVEGTNENGFRLNGNWVNYSQYGYHGSKYQPYSPTPNVGQFVTVTLTKGKFINSLSMGNAVATPAPQAQPEQQAAPAPVAQTPTQALNERVNNFQNNFIQTSIDTRLAVLKTMAVAQPGMFADLDKIETLTEIVRVLETFVLEELTTTATSTPEDEDPDADDLVDDI